MTRESNDNSDPSNLRLRALSRLAADSGSVTGRGDQAAAFQALYDMALVPATAPRALALLHELQVHQVELDLQEEELRRSRLEIETALARQIQIFEFLPVALLTIDAALTVNVLNFMAARVFRVDRDALLGLCLDGIIDVESARALRSTMAGLAAGIAFDPCVMTLVSRDPEKRKLNASLSRDPGSECFLLAVTVAEPKSPVG
jgi:PAS domain-containing protein